MKFNRLGIGGNHHWLNLLRLHTIDQMPERIYGTIHTASRRDRRFWNFENLRYFFTDFGILKDRLEEEKDFYVLGKYHASNQIIQQASLFAERRSRAEGG